MRKVYVLRGWNPESKFWISGIYSSKRKAEFSKKLIEEARKEAGDTNNIYDIKTEVLQ